MRKHLLLLIVLFVANIAISQTVTVKDQHTQLPIEGVFLISNVNSASIITNARGEANIELLKNQEYIEVLALGYKTIVTSFSNIEKSGFAIALEPSNMNLDEVVISATRSNQVNSNIPSKIVSIKQADIAMLNPQTAADLLGGSGKVFIQKSQQGGGSPMIRGFATNRLIYTVDGIRINTAIFRAGNIQNVINLDPFATEKAEVLFGPGSVIYGSDAIGGVMSFQTLTPELSATEKTLVTGKAVMRYSSANQENTGHFDVNVGWKKWAFVTSFSAWDFDHLRQGSHGPEDYIKPIYVQRQDSIDRIITQEDPLLQIPSAYSQVNMMQKIRFKPNEKWDIQYGFHYSETSSYGRYDRHNRYRNGTLRYAEWNYGPQTWMMNTMSVSHYGNNKIYDQLNVRVANQKFEESRIDRTLNRDERNTQTENVNTYSINIDFVKSLKSKHTLYYGAEYVMNDVTSKGELTDISTNESIIGPSRYPQSTWASAAVYINEEFRLNNQLTLQGGARFNQYTLSADFANNLDFYPFPFETANIDNSAITGSIGAVYRPNNTWAIRANVGTAFRSPNVDDIGKIFDSEPGALTVPNPDLKAEYATNFDLGIAKVFSEKIKIDLAGYYTILENALVRRDFTLNGVDSILYDGEMSKIQAIQNAASATVYGLQAGLNVKLPQGFYTSIDLNYQIGEEELDDGSVSASRHAAPFFGTARFGYQANKLNIQFYGMYQAERSFETLPEEEKAKTEIYAKDKNGNNYSPSWYTLNLKTMYKVSDDITVSGGIENITDQRYRPYSSGISGAGRNFVLSLQVKF